MAGELGRDGSGRHSPRIKSVSRNLQDQARQYKCPVPLLLRALMRRCSNRGSTSNRSLPLSPGAEPKYTDQWAAPYRGRPLRSTLVRMSQRRLHSVNGPSPDDPAHQLASCHVFPFLDWLINVPRNGGRTIASSIPQRPNSRAASPAKSGRTEAAVRRSREARQPA